MAAKWLHVAPLDADFRAGVVNADDEHERVWTYNELREFWGDDVYPPYVVTAAERHRWEVCHDLAMKVASTFGTGSAADLQAVWHLERELYYSDRPTD